MKDLIQQDLNFHLFFKIKIFPLFFAAAAAEL